MAGNVLAPSLRRGLRVKLLAAIVLAALAVCLDSPTNLIGAIKRPFSTMDTPCVILYHFDSVTYTGMFGLHFSAMLAALPAAGQYAEEYKMSPYMLTRSSTLRYGLAKMLCAALCGGLALMLGIALNFALLSIKFPLVSRQFLLEFQGMPYYELMAQKGGIGYAAVCVYLAFLRGFFWGGAAMCVSAFLQDIFIVTASPMVFSFLFNQLGRFSGLKVEQRPDRWLVAYSWLGSAGRTLAASSAFILLIWVLCCFIFVKKLKGGRRP